MFLLKSKQCNQGILIPQSINEITPELLTKLTDRIALAPYYALIASVAHTDLFHLATKFNNTSSKEGIALTHLIAKYNIPTEDKDRCINFKVGDKAIITMTDYQMSTYISVGSAVSTARVLEYINADNELRKECTSKTYDRNLLYHKQAIDAQSVIEDCRRPLYTIDFRIIAINNIHAVVDSDKRIDDPMLVNME